MLVTSFGWFGLAVVIVFCLFLAARKQHICGFGLGA